MNEVPIGQEKPQCKAGELARIKTARNKFLEGKLVLVRGRYSATEWVVRMLDGPALVRSEDRSRYVVTSILIADEWALEPLSRIGCSAIGDATGALAARCQTEAVEECT